MSNYEAYKPSTGAMGDRLTAMKAAFQVGSTLGLLFSPENAAACYFRLWLCHLEHTQHYSPKWWNEVQAGLNTFAQICQNYFLFCCLFAVFLFWILHLGLILLGLLSSSGVIAIKRGTSSFSSV